MVVSKRKFNLLDAMVLVAFTAFGLVWCIAFRESIRLLAQPPAQLPFPNDDPFELERPVPRAPAEWQALIGDAGDPLALRAHILCRYSTFFLLMWGIAFLVLRLRTPRPRLRRLIRSPGAAACITALVVLLVEFLDVMTVWIMNLVRPLQGFQVEATARLWEIVQSFGGNAGPAIVATWLILALSRKMVYEWNWLEVFGMLVGICWILLLFENAFCNFLWSLPA